MCDEQDDPSFFSRAEWFARLSESSRKRGEVERADFQLLLAWAAYEAVEVDAKITGEEPSLFDPNIAAA